MRMVKGILIDPFQCTVEEVEHDADNYRGIYDLISHESMPVDTFTIVHLDDGDAIFVDDEGLLKPCVRFFKWRTYHQPLAGKGLILGSDRKGDTISAKISRAKAEDMVTFAALIGNVLFDTREPWKADA